MSDTQQPEKKQENKQVQMLEALRKKQNPQFGIIAGVASSIVITFIWIVIAHKLKVSWMSLAAAFGIAFSIQFAGKTVDLWYGIVGGTLSLLAALTGHMSTAILLLSKYKEISVAQVLSELTFSKFFTYFSALMQPLDFLMYAGAVFAGFWFSFKHIKIDPLQD